MGRKQHRIETSDGLIPAQGPEGIFDAHPRVRRSALVGIGPRGRQRPVLCVELEPGATLTPDLTREIVALADDTRWAGVVVDVLAHPGFPTDTRHNSKIRREDLRPWVERQLGARQLTG
jgi:acyl-coenzyme A synthetase/AMP-(fatty) acid ligase